MKSGEKLFHEKPGKKKSMRIMPGSWAEERKNRQIIRRVSSGKEVKTIAMIEMREAVGKDQKQNNDPA